MTPGIFHNPFANLESEGIAKTEPRNQERLDALEAAREPSKPNECLRMVKAGIEWCRLRPGKRLVTFVDLGEKIRAVRGTRNKARTSSKLSTFIEPKTILFLFNRVRLEASLKRERQMSDVPMGN